MSEPEKKSSAWPWIVVPLCAFVLFFVLRECQHRLPPAPHAPAPAPAATVPAAPDVPPAEPKPDESAAPAPAPAPQ
ncbi:MAG TPA: hypothetical protein VMF52_14615 [Steroidobacteraceae bacterium]|nr:hypothetical protein [Steroidobacteraceae bacterium]